MLLAKHLAIHSFCFVFICELLINVFIERVDIAQSSAHSVENSMAYVYPAYCWLVWVISKHMRGRETQFLDLGVRFRISDTVIFSRLTFFVFSSFFFSSELV